MSTGRTTERNGIVVPGVMAAIIIVVIVGYLVLRGNGDEAPAAPKATATATAAPAETATDTLAGSGDAPDAIAVQKVTVARSGTGFGLAADLPKIDLQKFDSVTLVLGQDDGKVLWNLKTFRDSRGSFITPELFLSKEGPDEQFACTGSAMRINATRLTMTVPLACLDNPEKPLRARLEITDRDGGEEKTSTSKALKAPKA